MIRLILYYLRIIFGPDSGSSGTLDYDQYIIDRITAMRESQNLTFEEIVNDLNEQGLKAVFGKGQWTVKMVEKLYVKESLKRFNRLKKL